MNTTSLPFSALIKLKEAENGEDGDHKKKTREEWKKAKELEEARKAGTVPAAVDEEGRDINPHIPQYISAAPWYFGQLGATLKHQRPQPEKQQEFDRLTKFYTRGLKGSKSNKYRKGACENCGALGHKKKDCVERPRKVGAKYTNSCIISDDVSLPELALDYDGKRDRWNGYDPSEYDAVVEEHQKVEEYKRQLKAQKLDGGDLEDNIDDDDDEANDDDEKYADHIDMPGTKVDSKQRITVRNLRIREDTAKYLRNLDLSSAYYDPKTRSMRDNPYSNTKVNPDEVQYAGENFVRFSGDTVEQAKAQTFAWEAYEKGVDISLQAEPTKLEILKKEFLKKKEEFKQNVSNDLLEKYGGKEHLHAPPREMLLSQSEHYIEYSRQGKIIKGVEKDVIRSSYEEDVHPNNHTSVWGSFWQEGQWGYDCCHLFIKNSYCTGEAGKSKENPICTLPPSESKLQEEEKPTKTLVEMHTEAMNNKRSAKSKKKLTKKLKKNTSSSDDSISSSSSESSGSDSSSEDEDEKRKKLLRKALIEAKLEEDKGNAMLETDDRLRNYNSMTENRKLTEEQVEAYQIRRKRPEDPMANF